MFPNIHMAVNNHLYLQFREANVFLLVSSGKPKTPMTIHNSKKEKKKKGWAVVVRSIL